MQNTVNISSPTGDNVIKSGGGDIAPRLQATRAKLDEMAMNTQIPKEILWLVFQRAIPPKSLLDPFLCAGPDSPCARTLELKKNLTLVCRAWYDVGTSFLYEDVTISRLPQIQHLLRTLESTCSNGLGKLIKSLELKCYIPRGTVATHFEQTLQSLLGHCIALNYLSYFSPCTLPHAVFQIDNPLPTTITELHLDIMVQVGHIRRIVGHLQGRLQYLRTWVPLEIIAFRQNEPGFCFPCLHTLWLETLSHEWGPELQHIAAWSFPTLQRLIISHARLTAYTYIQWPRLGVAGPHMDEEDIMLSFLTQLGPKLRYLRLKHRPTWDRGFIPQLLARCPLVERISFDMTYVTYNANCPIGPHPKLQCVDFLLANRDLDVYFTTTDTPSFIGIRKLYGLPPFAYQWLNSM